MEKFEIRGKVFPRILKFSERVIFKLYTPVESQNESFEGFYCLNKRARGFYEFAGFKKMSPPYFKGSVWQRVNFMAIWIQKSKSPQIFKYTFMNLLKGSK